MQSKNLDVQYTATAISVGGRNGEVHTPNGEFKLETTEPKELGGKGEAGKTNPEQLFAAGYAACFGSAAKLAAETMNLNINADALEVTCHVSMGRDDEENGFGLKVKMEMNVDGLEADASQRLIQKANDLCPFTKALQGNVDVELVVK